MRNFKFNEQLQIEPGYYYHIGMPFDLKHVDAEIFNEGYHFGQFASYIEIEKGLYRAVRDPLGIGKLFYTETSDGKIHFSDKYYAIPQSDGAFDYGRILSNDYSCVFFGETVDQLIKVIEENRI